MGLPMGLLGVYRRQIKNFAQKAKPMYDLLKERDSQVDPERSRTRKPVPKKLRVNHHHVLQFSGP